MYRAGAERSHHAPNCVFLDHIKFLSRWGGGWRRGGLRPVEAASLMLLCTVHICFKILTRSLLTYQKTTSVQSLPRPAVGFAAQSRHCLSPLLVGRCALWSLVQLTHPENWRYPMLRTFDLRVLWSSRNILGAGGGSHDMQHLPIPYESQ